MVKWSYKLQGMKKLSCENKSKFGELWIETMVEWSYKVQETLKGVR